jgi:Heparinase II/III-like protein/Heparinase II/III N-terminus
MGEPMSKLTTALQVGRTFGVRDGMLRLEYELRRGSGLLSWKMKSVQGWDSWGLRRIAPDVSSDEMLAARRNGTRPFFFFDARGLASNLRNAVGADGENSIRADAERILAGNVPFFGQLSFSSDFPPRWFENPVTGQRVSPQQSWTQMRFASPIYGDLKFILEPSRFLFVYPLVRAYALSGDERYTQAFWSAVEEWACQSPPMTGPLWICGQECSLRILALSFALHGFIHSPSTTNERVASLVSMIAAHAWRTAQTLVYARSQRSNHLITEAVGLWTTGTLFPELREAEVWRNLGAHLLHEAVLDQITPEGVSQQHSFNYQRMILHLLLWTLRLAEIHDAPLHESIRARTEAAYDFMRAWIDPVSGSAPNYGSDDGSLILPLSLGSYHDFRPLLQLAAALLNRPPLEAGPWDEAALWFGMTNRVEPTATKYAGSSPSVETGYFRLGDNNSWALIRASQYTRRPFQADQLHVDLWWRGVNLARDPGTYLYNGPPPWNNGFASTAVHNTVTIDNHDQMRRAGRFLWLDWAQAGGRLYSSNNHVRVDRFEGEHDGYKSLGITHRRMVQWLDGAGWAIVDDIDGRGSHVVRLHWLAPDLPYEFSNAPFRVTFGAAQSKIRWNIFAGVSGDALVTRAGKLTATSSVNEFVDAGTELLGWESPTYGDLQPAVSLVYQTHTQLPVRLVTLILTDERYEVETVDSQIIVLRSESRSGSSGQAEVFRVNLSARKTSAAENLLLPPMKQEPNCQKL